MRGCHCRSAKEGPAARTPLFFLESPLSDTRNLIDCIQAPFLGGHSLPGIPGRGWGHECSCCAVVDDPIRIVHRSAFVARRGRGSCHKTQVTAPIG